jgi:hypothetical protein
LWLNALKKRAGPAGEAVALSGAEHVRKPHEEERDEQSEEKADHGVSDETGAEFIHFFLLSPLKGFPYQLGLAWLVHSACPPFL